MGLANCAAALAVCVLALLSAGCRGDRAQPDPGAGELPTEPPPPAVTGLGTVPADARVVVGFDVHGLSQSSFVGAVARAVVERDADLKAMLTALRDQCGIDPVAMRMRGVLALGPQDENALLAVSAVDDEPGIIDCARRRDAIANRDELNGRPVFRVRGAGGDLWLARGRPDTLVVSLSREWMARALGRGVKISENDLMLEQLAAVDRHQAAWFVARVDPVIGAGVVEVTDGRVSEAPVAARGQFDPASGQLVMAVVLATPADAKGLSRFFREQQDPLTSLAQGWGLGPLVGRVAARQEDSAVVFSLAVAEGDGERFASALNDASAAPSAPQRVRRKRRKRH